MMKGALENVEVLHFFFISVLWGDLVLSPSPSLPHPPAYSHSSGINDKEEWIQRRGGGRGRLDGKWTTPIKRIRLISGCRIAAHRCEQVRCHPTRFSLSLTCASYAMYRPLTQHPIHLTREGRRREEGELVVIRLK